MEKGRRDGGKREGWRREGGVRGGGGRWTSVWLSRGRTDFDSGEPVLALGCSPLLPTGQPPCQGRDMCHPCWQGPQVSPRVSPTQEH